jgi:hypothetical protein
MDSRVLWEPRAKVEQVLREFRGPEEGRRIPEHKEFRVLRASKATRVLREHRVIKVLRAIREIEVL